VFRLLRLKVRTFLLLLLCFRNLIRRSWSVARPRRAGFREVRRVPLRVPAHAGAGLGHPRRAALAGRRDARHCGQRLLRPLRRRRRARGKETARRLRQDVVRGSRVVRCPPPSSYTGYRLRPVILPCFSDDTPRRGLSVFDSCLLPSARRLVVAAAAVMFLYGASRNAGGTGGFTAIRRRPGRNSDGGVSTFDFVCDELRGVFVLASIAAVVAVACAITAYVDTLQRRNQTATPPTLGVAMGQPDPAPVAYPAQPPYGGYGAKQPAGTS
jgi:hypothetical protein